MKERQKNTQTRPMNAALPMTDFSSDQTDPQGSYTGCPIDPEEKPVQDVDDL